MIINNNLYNNNLLNEWHTFTLKNIYYFINNKYNLTNSDKLLIFINNEKKYIIKFMLNKIDIFIHKIYNYDLNKLKKLCYTKWVDTKNVIKEINRLKNIYEIKWNDNKIIINYDKIDDKLITKLYIIIYIIEYIKNKINSKKKILIYLVLSNLEKKLFNIDKSEIEIIGVKNINSGYTDHKNNLIFIWRYEEFEKVIFHEIIHYLKLDKLSDLNYKLFKINGPHSYFEAVTDFYGILYNTIFISILTNHNIKSLLEIELAFIRNQALFINNYFNLGKWNNIPNIIINQNSPAFSYYILKYILFEYSIKNNFDNILNYDDIFKIGINQDINNYIDCNSCRMSLLSLE
jgi:hypothetical protein